MQKKNLNLFNDLGAQQLRKFIDSANDGIYMLDCSGCFTFFNKKAEIITGYKSADVLGKHFMKLGIVDASSSKKAVSEFRRRLSGIKGKDYEITLVRKTGEKLPIELSTAAVFSGKKVVGVLGIGRDISLRRYLEQELHKKMERLSALYDVRTTISSSLDLEKIINLIIVKIIKLTKVDICEVVLFSNGPKKAPISSVYHTEDGLYTEFLGVHHCISKEAISEKKPIYISDVKTSKKCASSAKILTSFLSIPLKSREAVMGTINLGTKNLRVFSEGEQSILIAFAEEAASSIENARLYRQVMEDKRDLTALFEASQEINSTLDYESLLKKMLDKCVEITNAKQGSIHILDAEKKFSIKYASGFTQEQIDGFNKAVQVGMGLTSAAAKKGEILVIKDVSKDKRYYEVSPDIKSELVIPLLLAEKVVGVLNLESDQYDHFSHYSKMLLMLTNKIALLLENAKLYQEIKHFNETLQEEIYRATRELEEKNLKLMELDRLKSDFISAISHELRTPLTSIKGYISLLLMEKIKNPAIQKKCLHIINDETNRLKRLIEDILDLSYLESGKINFNPTPCAVRQIIQESNNSMIGFSLRSKVSLKCKLPDNDIIFPCDKDKIEQVLTNLLSNAIKFSEQNSIVTLTSQENQNSVAFFVKDVGIGINEETIPKLFDKFFRVENSTTRKKSGTGLGLAIVKEIVGLHKGFVAVKSALNNGTIFAVILPKNIQGFDEAQKSLKLGVVSNHSQSILSILPEGYWTLVWVDHEGVLPSDACTHQQCVRLISVSPTKKIKLSRPKHDKSHYYCDG